MACGLSLLLLTLATIAGCAKSDPVAENAAREATAPWLALMDAGDYEACWSGASPLFRKEERKDVWVSKATGYRSPLGAFKSRAPNVTRIIPNPWGAPDGLYAAVVFDSTWENGKIYETVYMQQQPGGGWLVAGYAVQQQR